MDKKYLVIDVGGSFIKHAVMTEKAEILEKGKTPTPYEGLEKYLETLLDIHRQYSSNIEISGIALSVPGIVDSDKGFQFTGGSLEYVSNLPLASILAEKCGVPITVENDGKCAALAEAWNGSLKGCKDGIVILLGTGIGGGIIKDGKVHKGQHFSAGEFSFIQMGDQYESVENVWGMQCGNKRLRKMVGAVKQINPDELDGFNIFDFAKRGDPDVLKVLDQFTMQVAKVIFNLQAIYDPELIAIGGGISREELLIELLRKNAEYIYREFPMKIPRAQIVQCHFFNEANLIGALRTLQLMENRK